MRLTDVNECVCGQPATANGRECGTCFRDRIGSVGLAKSSPATNRRWDNRLERYKATREEGSQPSSTTAQAIDDARRISDYTGKPFRSNEVFG